jgi:hypothetical protein
VSGLLLLVVVLEADVMLHFLLLLSRTVANLNRSQVALHLPIVKNLLAAHVFLLHSPKFIGFLLGLFEHFLLSHLLGPLMKNGILLLLVKPLKVVGLYAVRSQHRLLSGGVLSHEIVSQSEIHFLVSVVLQVSGEMGITVALLFSHLLVSLLSGHENSLEPRVVLRLSSGQDGVVLAGQVVLIFVSPTLVFFVELLFGDLLLNPVLLL